MIKFVYESGRVFVSDDKPGNHATLFVDGVKALFDGAGSRFDDSRSAYTWAFVVPRVEQVVVFATADREGMGVIRGGVIEVVPMSGVVERQGDKPHAWRRLNGVDLASPGAASEKSVLVSLEAPPMLKQSQVPLVVVPRNTDPTASGRGRGARVLAIFPGVQSPGAGWDTLRHESANNESAYMAHGMSYVSSYLKSRGHHVWLLDTRACRGWAHFEEEVRKQDYDFAMLGPLSIEAFTAACIVRVLKEAHPNKPVILGGLHVSMTKDKEFPPNDLAKYYFYGEPPSRMREYLDSKGERDFNPSRWPKADYLVWNEGELATAAIVEGQDLAAGGWDYEETSYGTVFLNGKIVPDLNDMPHMDRSLFNEEMEKNHPLLPELPAPFHTVTFGRGCPYKCSYCSVGVQFSSTKVRLIDPDYFMEELEHLRQSDGGKIGSLMIHDDILLFPKWLEEWNEKIKQRFGFLPYWCQMRADFICNHPDLVKHMSEAGMTWVSVGYEVGHARGLNGIMNKGLKLAGVDDPVEINVRASEVLRSLRVNSFGNFIFGSPTETNEEMDATVRMIQRIQPQHHGFSTYADFPGTPMSKMITDLDLRMPEWYARSHYPWQYRIKGVDYDHVRRCIEIASQTPKQYLNPLRRS